jgi:hypothetical protein
MTSLIVAAAALLIAGASSATHSAQEPPAVKPGTDSGQKVICHEVGVTGSRLGTKRICRTAIEERQAKMNDRDMIEPLQRGFSHCGPDPVRC